MKAKTMHTSAFGSLVLAAALSSTWIGCVTDVTPQKGAEKTGESSAAIAAAAGSGSFPQCPDDASAYPIQAYARHHRAGWIKPPGQNDYTDVAPTPCTNPGMEFDCGTEPGEDIHAYEVALFDDVTNSNGYEYKVVVPALHSQDYYVGVGINQASVGWSPTPPPAPGFAPGGSPSTHDYEAETSLVSGPLNTANVKAYNPPLACVAVYAEDTGELLDTFVMMDVHDPDKGSGW